MVSSPAGCDGVESRQFRGAAGEARDVGRQLGGDDRGGRSRDWPGQSWVVGQDRRLEIAQLLARFQAEFPHEPVTGAPVRLQRLGTPPAAVQREHELRPEPFAERMLVDQPLHLVHDLGVGAQLQPRVQTQLKGGETGLVEPQRLGGDGRSRWHVGEGGSPPQRQRVGPVRDGAFQIRGPPAGLHGLLEHGGVDVARLQDQLVTAPPRDERALRAAAESAPQVHHVALDRAHRGTRRALAPQLVDQPVGADHLTGLGEQDRQHGALLRGSDRRPGERRPTAATCRASGTASDLRPPTERQLSDVA